MQCKRLIQVDINLLERIPNTQISMSEVLLAREKLHLDRK